MLRNIIDLLQVVKGETDRIKFAQGSKYLPPTFKKGFTQAKKESHWPRKK